jgi:hypothetical protein
MLNALTARLEGREEKDKQDHDFTPPAEQY